MRRVESPWSRRRRKSSDRFARYLEKLGVEEPLLRFLDGRPVAAAADVVLNLPDASFGNVRLKAGEATITGSGRYTAPEGTTRGRLEAQVAVQGLNLDQLPRVSSIFDATQNLDVGFTVDARNVRAGQRGGAGRITARILSDGPALRVESSRHRRSRRRQRPGERAHSRPTGPGGSPAR